MRLKLIILDCNIDNSLLVMTLLKLLRFHPFPWGFYLPKPSLLIYFIIFYECVISKWFFLMVHA